MDHRLVAWGRAVKSRGRHAGPALPPLWLFTDATRLPDPAAAAARLPRGLCGIVFRHDDVPDRVALGRALAHICRVRRLTLAVAGDWRLAAALGAGLHLRGGRLPAGVPRRLPVLTSSAHGVVELRRARRSGAAVAFLSPVFPTASHPDAPALGAVRWARLTATSTAAAALGGLDGRSVWRLRRCRHAGAIGALA